MRVAAVVLIAALFPLDLLAQGPPPPPPPPVNPMMGPGTPKTGTARLSGRVTTLDNGRPIRRALIRASGPDLPEGKTISTDAEGRWELRDLPGGRYTISVSKGGYVTLAYGQQRPNEPGKQVTVENGKVIEKLDVALPRGSAVTGRVLDEFGEPVTNVRVVAGQYRMMNGQRRLMPLASNDTTDDLGQFRLHGLPPGDYYVWTQPQSFTFVGSSEDRSGYGQTYFPGTLNPAEATRITLSLGQEAQNVLIALAPTRIANLSGTVTTSNGKAVGMGMMMLRSLAAPDVVRPGIVRDGAWTISGVPPGEYQLIAQFIPNLEQVATTGSTRSLDGVESTFQNITVSGEDITGLALTTSAGGTARGVVRFEGAAPTGVKGATVRGLDLRGMEITLMTGGGIDAEGAFELKGLVGLKMLRVFGLPPGWWVKSVAHEGSDVTDSPIDFGTGRDISGIEIVLTQNMGELSGTVQDQKGTAVTNYSVVVFSPDSTHWTTQSRFVRTARPDQTGRFTVGGLPPGSYLAVALEYLEPGQETDPEFLERLKALGSPVRVAGAEKKPLVLKLSGQ